MFGIQPKLLQELAATVGQTLFSRGLGPAILTAGMLKKQTTLVGEDEDRLREFAVYAVAYDLLSGHFGEGVRSHPVLLVILSSLSDRRPVMQHSIHHIALDQSAVGQQIEVAKEHTERRKAIRGGATGVHSGE